MDKLSRPYLFFSTPYPKLWEFPLPYHYQTGLSETLEAKILAHFPAKSRINLKSECTIVQQCTMSPSNKANKQQTACTRWIHFIYWCKIRGFYDAIFSLIMLSSTKFMYAMAMYAAFLATSHAIAIKSIRSGTI